MAKENADAGHSGPHVAWEVVVPRPGRALDNIEEDRKMREFMGTMNHLLNTKVPKPATVAKVAKQQLGIEIEA